jgi:hypothetical protein
MAVAFGWDASDFDWARGPVNVAAAVADGINFFTHKATEGTRFQHTHYAEAIARARATNIPAYGAYFVPRTPGNGSNGTIPDQVKYFIAYLDSQTPYWRTDPRFRILQVDTEKWGYDDVSPALGAQACALLQGYGKYVTHYAPAWAYGNGIPGSDPLWGSSYGTNPAVPYRQGYRGDRAWPADYSGRPTSIWQFGSKLTIGSQPSCDANAIKDPQVWAELLGGNHMGTLDGTQADWLESIFRWVEATRDGNQSVVQATGNGGHGTFTNILAREITKISGNTDASRAMDASNATAINGLQTAITAMAAAINAGGGNIDTASILAQVQDSADSVRAFVEQQHADERAADDQRHQEEMAAIQAQHAKQMAGLQAQLNAMGPS